jgi:glycosyltransferase involved in cell wall biosynthesis
MKGPKHWLDSLEIVVRSSGGGPSGRATWFGGGPLLNEMRDAVAMRKLSSNVSFPGPEVDRSRLLLEMRRADLFVLCHLTPESPRCLIEAFILGVPWSGSRVRTHAISSVRTQRQLISFQSGILMPSRARLSHASRIKNGCLE